MSELDEQVTTLMGSLSAAGSDDTTAQAVTQIQKDLGILQQELGSVTTLTEYVNTISENVTTAKSELDKINVTDLETEALNQAKEKAKNAVNTAISETEASTKKDVMDRLKETESYKSLTSEQQEELENAVNTASGTSSSAETECDSMNISLTNASGAKTEMCIRDSNGSIGKLPKFTFIQEMLQFRRQIIVVAHICIKTDSGTDGVASL